MKRILLLLASLALVAAACTASAPAPPLPEAGCYYVSVPGGWGSTYFTGVAPTPSNAYNFRIYNQDADCTPSAQTAAAIGVSAATEQEVFGKCAEQAGVLTLPGPYLTAETYMRLGPAFRNVWLCQPLPPLWELLGG